jgi:GTP-binding protein EngB required for normal cell division
VHKPFRLQTTAKDPSTLPQRQGKDVLFIGAKGAGKTLIARHFVKHLVSDRLAFAAEPSQSFEMFAHDPTHAIIDSPGYPALNSGSMADQLQKSRLTICLQRKTLVGTVLVIRNWSSLKANLPWFEQIKQSKLPIRIVVNTTEPKTLEQAKKSLKQHDLTIDAHSSVQMYDAQDHRGDEKLLNWIAKQLDISTHQPPQPCTNKAEEGSYA